MTAPRKSAAPLSPKFTLALAGTAVAAMAVFALQPSDPSAAPEQVQQITAAPSKAPATAAAALQSPPPRGSSDERELSAPEAATKVSQRPVASSSSSSFPGAAAPAAAAPSHSSAGNNSVIPSGRSPLFSDTSIRSSSSSGENASAAERRAAADAVSIAQSAAMPSLPHSVSDEQAQQIAPHVPQETLEQVRNQFEENTGSGQLDPGDPEYARRWDSAERLAAAQMRSLYGWAAYSEMQRQAALSASAQQGN